MARSAHAGQEEPDCRDLRRTSRRDHSDPDCKCLGCRASRRWSSGMADQLQGRTPLRSPRGSPLRPPTAKSADSVLDPTHRRRLGRAARRGELHRGSAHEPDAAPNRCGVGCRTPLRAHGCRLLSSTRGDGSAQRHTADAAVAEPDRKHGSGGRSAERQARRGRLRRPGLPGSGTQVTDAWLLNPATGRLQHLPDMPAAVALKSRACPGQTTVGWCGSPERKATTS